MESVMDRRVIDAAIEWLVERTPRDPGEKKLAAAIARAYPEEIHTKDNCTCGESEDCDECLTAAAWEQIILGWERDTTPIAESVA